MKDTSNGTSQAPGGTLTLEQGIEQAGSPVHLLWRPDATPLRPAGVQPEFVGWRVEQEASKTAIALSDQSHHMRDLFIEGPDATRLLAAVSVNDYEHFEVGQAKQFVAVDEQGYYVADSVLLRTAPDQYVLTGMPPAMSWVLFHAEQGSYDVTFVDDPATNYRAPGVPPVLFRYEVQGPRALELVAQVFGGPLPETKFFHSTVVSLDGRSVRALRHGMTGQPGYEFIGQWEDGAYVKDALLTAGADFGLVQVGSMAYSTNPVASGWVPFVTPSVFTDPQLKSYREWLTMDSFEAITPLQGSFFSENIEDYYVSPYELGYGKLISLKHDFIGRDALARARDEKNRTKVTLVVDKDDAHRVFGDDIGFFTSSANYRVEAGGDLVGMTLYGAHLVSEGTILFLALADSTHAEPGTPVTLVYGESPGFDRDESRVSPLTRLRATVQASPYDAFAREQYRRN